MNQEWVQGILQWKNTPHKSTGLSPAIMLYGHPVQDAIPCHKSALTRDWHDQKLKIDREAATRKEKLEQYHNRSAHSLPPLNVGDPVCVQNAVTKRWDRYGTILERYEHVRRYLIKLESGMVIRRNRIHLRKRVTCDLSSGIPAVTDFNPQPESLTDTTQYIPVRRSNREKRPPRRFDDYCM